MLKEFNSKIVPPVAAQILCFKDWSDPPNFFTMSRRDRINLMMQMKEYSQEPSTTNHWIWFGAYAGRVPSPRYNDESVSRHLFECFVTDADGKRIVPTKLRQSYADVNPYKYKKALGLTLSQQRQLLREEAITPPENPADELVTRCIAEMKELYYPDVLDTKEKMAPALKHNGHTEYAIAEALKQWDFPDSLHTS